MIRRLLSAGAGHIAVAVCALVSIRFATELMPPAEFGMAMLATGLIVLLDGVLGMAVNQTLVALGAREHDDEQRRQTAAGLVVLLLRRMVPFAVAGLVVAALGRLLLGFPRWLAPFLLTGSVVVACDLLRSGVTGPMLAQRQNGRLAFWLGAEAVLTLLATLGLLIWLHGTAAAYLGGISVGRVLTSVLLLAATQRGGFYRRLDLRIAQRRWGEALNYGLPVSAMQPLGWAAAFFDRYLVGSFIGPAGAGLYVAAAGIAGRPYGVLGATLSTVFRPRLHAAGSGAGRDRQRWRETLNWLGLALGCGAAGVALFFVLGPLLASLLLAPDYRDAAPAVMLLMAAAQACLITTYALDHSMLAMRRSGLLLRIQMVLLPATLALVAIGAAQGGLLGAAAGRMFAEAARLAAMALCVWLLHRRRAAQLLPGE